VAYCHPLFSRLGKSLKGVSERKRRPMSGHAWYEVVVVVVVVVVVAWLRKILSIMTGQGGG